MKLSKAAPNMTYTKFIHKLREERKEVEHEVDLLCSEGCPLDVVDALMSEVFDVMQTCYTFLRSNFSEEEIQVAYKKHMEKMEHRHGKD